MRRSTSGLLRRSGRDFVCAFIVFAVLVSAVSGGQETTNPLTLVFAVLTQCGLDPIAGALGAGHVGNLAGVQIDQARSAGEALAVGRAIAASGAALLFSVIVAFQLAFFRHLRRVHASSRRGAWRGS